MIGIGFSSQSKMDFFVKLFVVAAFILSLGLANVAHAKWIFPTKGCVTSKFGPRNVKGGSRYHQGIDIGAPVGTPIRAMEAGRVVNSTYHSVAGNYVEVLHDGPYLSRYLHMVRIKATKGQTVARGEVIGYLGSTGRSTGPHLHVEILRGSAFGAPAINLNSAFPAIGGCIDPQAADGGFNEMNINLANAPDSSNSAPPDNWADQGNATPGQAGEIPPAKVDVKSILTWLLPEPVLWLERAMNVMEGKTPEGEENPKLINILQTIRNLAFVLMFGLFVYSLLHAIYFYKSSDYMEIFIRLGIATLLIMGSAGINKTLIAIWAGAYEASEGLYGEPTDKRLGEAVKLLAIEAGGATLALFGADVIGDLTGQTASGIKVNLFGTIGDNIKGAAIRFAQLLMTAVFMVILLYMIYGLGLYVSALTVLLIVLIFPIGAALLLRPEFTDFMLHTLSTYSTALIIIIVAPVVFMLVLDLAFVVPLEQLARDTSATGNSPLKLLPGVVSMLAQFVLTIILTIVGLVMAFMLSMDLERMIAEFLGGVSSTGTGSIGGIAQRYGGGSGR